MDGALPTSSQNPTTANGTTKKRKKRVRNFTPDDRAAHRDFEKSRRIAFNQRLLELASLLPGLATARLSKHTIVDESITHHTAQRESCLRAAREIQLLQAERDELITEVNALRAHHLPGQVNLREARPVDTELLQALDAPPQRPFDALTHLHDGELFQGSSHNQESNTQSMLSLEPGGNPSASVEAPLPVSAETEPFSIATTTFPAVPELEHFSISSSADIVPAPPFNSGHFDTITAPPLDEKNSTSLPPRQTQLDATNDANDFPQRASLDVHSAEAVPTSVGEPNPGILQQPLAPSDIDFDWQLDLCALYNFPPGHIVPSPLPDNSHESQLPQMVLEQHAPVIMPDSQQAWYS